MANYGNSNFRISDPITVDTNDLFPTHFAFLGKGGWRSVATEGDLATIPTQRLEAGSAAYVNGGSAPGLYIYDGSAWNITTLSNTAYTLPTASSSALGGVKVPNSGTIAINGSGDISVRTATTGQTGIVQPDGTTIGITNGIISLIGGTNLAVYNNSGTLTGTYSKLQFKGDLASVTSAALGGSTDTNVVTIDPPAIYYATSFWKRKEIEFAASGNLSIVTDDTIANRIKLTFGLTGSGTLKQHLYELSDVNGGNGTTGWAPTDGQVLKWIVNAGVGTWKAATHNTGIQLTDLGISNTTAGFPLTYNSTNGQFSLAASADGQDGYLTSGDRGTLFGKATWPTNPGSNISNYYLAPVSSTTPNWATFKDSYLNEYGKSLRVLCIASGSIAKGDIVSITTTSNSAGKPTVIKSSTSNVNIVGIAAEAKTNGQDIWIITKGLLSAVDTTSGINATGPIYATLTSPNYTLSTTPSYNAVLVGHCVYNNASGYILVDIQQLGGLTTYSTTLSANTAVSINLSEYASAAITYASTHAITSLTFTGGKIGERYPIRILQQATWNASNTFAIAANWVSGNAYTAGTRVRFEDSTDNTVAYYICITNVTSSTSPKADTTNWAKYITLPFGRDIALSPYNRAEDILMLNVTSTITVGTTVYPRIVIDTLYNV
jgi:hypothetical protein